VLPVVRPQDDCTGHLDRSRLFPEAGHGFLKMPDGRELYFHRHGVLHPGFDHLVLGTEVRFAAELGEKGP